MEFRAELDPSFSRPTPGRECGPTVRFSESAVVTFIVSRTRYNSIPKAIIRTITPLAMARSKAASSGSTFVHLCFSKALSVQTKSRLKAELG
jgi:hypothetical protein